MNLSNFKFNEILILLIILIIGIPIVIGSIIFIFNKFLKKDITLKGKNGQLIKIGNKDIHSSDILFIVEKITSITMKKDKIKFISILKKQMDYVELRLLKIKGILQSQYLKILSEKNKSQKNLTSDEDYQYYSVLLDISFKDCRGILRTSFQDNNIPDFENNFNIWKKYVQAKTEGIMQKHTDFLNKMYIGNDKDVNREEIHNFTFTKEVYNEICTIIDDIFKEAFKLKKDFEIKLSKLDNELKLFFETYISLDRNN